MRSFSAVPSRLLRKMCEAQDLQLFSDSLADIIPHLKTSPPSTKWFILWATWAELSSIQSPRVNIKIIGLYFQNKSIHFSPFYIFIALVFYLWAKRLSFCHILRLSLDMCREWVHTILIDPYVSDLQKIVQKKKSRFWALIIPAALWLAQLFLQPLKDEMCWKKPRKIIIMNQFSAQLPAANPCYYQDQILDVRFRLLFTASSDFSTALPVHDL